MTILELLGKKCQFPGRKDHHCWNHLPSSNSNSQCVTNWQATHVVRKLAHIYGTYSQTSWLASSLTTPFYPRISYSLCTLAEERHCSFVTCVPCAKSWVAEFHGFLLPLVRREVDGLSELLLYLLLRHFSGMLIFLEIFYLCRHDKRGQGIIRVVVLVATFFWHPHFLEHLKRK